MSLVVCVDRDEGAEFDSTRTAVYTNENGCPKYFHHPKQKLDEWTEHKLGL
jgi:hypothetical protein